MHWLDKMIADRWNDPEFRDAYIDVTQEIYDETGVDTFDKIEEYDKKYLNE